MCNNLSQPQSTVRLINRAAKVNVNSDVGALKRHIKNPSTAVHLFLLLPGNTDALCGCYRFRHKSLVESSPKVIMNWDYLASKSGLRVMYLRQQSCATCSEENRLGEQTLNGDSSQSEAKAEGLICHSTQIFHVA